MAKLSDIQGILDNQGFFAHFSSLGDGNTRVWDWTKLMRDRLSGDVKRLWEFFLCGMPMKRSVLDGLLGEDLVNLILTRKLAEESTAGHLSLGGLSLVQYRDLFLFVDRSAQTARAIFGEEAKALLSVIPLELLGSFVGYNSTCGLEGIVALRRGAKKVRLMIENYDHALIQANLELNGCGKRARLVSTAPEDWPTDPVDGMAATAFGFPEAEGVPMPAILAGGTGGIDKLLQSVEVARKCLSEEGQFSFVATFFSVGDVVEATKELKKIFRGTGLGGSVLLLAQFKMEPGSPIFNQMLGYSGAVTGKKSAEMIPSLGPHLEKHRLQAAYLVKGILKRGSKNPIKIFDYSQTYYGGWTF